MKKYAYHFILSPYLERWNILHLAQNLSVYLPNATHRKFAVSLSHIWGLLTSDEKNSYSLRFHLNFRDSNDEYIYLLFKKNKLNDPSDKINLSTLRHIVVLNQRYDYKQFDIDLINLKLEFEQVQIECL